MDSTDRRHGTGRLGDVIRSVAIPAGFAGVALVAGTLGYYRYLPSLPAYSDATTLTVLAEGFFRSLGFLVLSMGAIASPSPLEFALFSVGRAAGLLFFSYAAVVGIGIVFADQLRPLRIEAWSLVGRLPGVSDRGHVVVCGVGDDGYALAKEALEAGRNVAAIDPERTDRTADLESMGAVVLAGDATSEAMLTGRARLGRAADVFVTTDSDETNGAVVEAIDRWAASSDRERVVDVTARIADGRLRRTLHEETAATSGVYLRTYDVPSATARELLAASPVDDIERQDERVHVWLVGWTPLSKAVLDQLLHLMHYPEGIDRQVTVVTDTPDATERDIAALSPGIDPEWWDDESMQRFVQTLFPDVDVRPLPGSDMELLSDRNPLYDELQHGDRLTIVADDTDERSLRALLSTWGPKLDELTRQLELDAHLAYRGTPDSDWTPSTDAVATTAFSDFGDGCSISSVRGAERDTVARRLALVYHLLYEDDPLSAFPWRDSISVGPESDFDAILDWLQGLSPAERERHATAVWRDLPEYQRESNRHAADHAAVKHRLADVIGGGAADTDAVVRALAAAEHRRWCAEKILDGWEPLPEEATDRWHRDGDEQALRDQRYNPNIVPVETLRERGDDEWDKDVSQVRAILGHPELVGYRDGTE